MSKIIFHLLTVFFCGISLAARAANLIAWDTFTDGSRSNTNGGDPPGLVYYMGQTNSTLVVTNDDGGIGGGNALFFTPNPGSGYQKFLAYFGPVTLVNPGDSVTLTFNFRFASQPPNLGSGLRVGLYNSNGTRQTNDASDTGAPGPGDRSDDVGYGFQSNPGSNFTTGTIPYSEAAGNDILGGASPSQTSNQGTYGTAFNCGTNSHFAFLQLALEPGGNLGIVAYIDNGIAGYATISNAVVFTNVFDELGIEEGGSGFSVPIFFDNFSIVTTSAGDFDALRTSWWIVQTGGTNYNLNDSLVKSRLSTITNNALTEQSSMDKTGTNTYLWPDLTSTTDSSQLSTAYQRIQYMALAYATYGSSLRSNAALATNIQIALNWMTTNRYNASIPATSGEYDNWYDWEIGAPLQIADIVTYMYDTLGIAGLSNTLAAVAHFVPSPFSGTSGTSTGGNLTDKIRSVAVCGAVWKDASKVTIAANAFSGLFPYVTNGDGYYADGSFIQHTHHPYNGSYGQVAIQDTSLVLPWLDGACWQYTTNQTQTNVIVPWRCTDPNFTNVVQWVYNSYQPFVYYGEMMDMTRGRAMSRYSDEAHTAGGSVIQYLLTLAESSFPATNDAANILSMVKYWAQVDTFRSFTNNVPINLITPTEQLMANTNITPRGELVGHWTYGGMDQAVHLRPGWGMALSMSSSRVYNYESINNENLHGWFQGDGATYIYTSNDLASCSSNYWPTVDPYSLPGTTVDTTTLAASAGQSSLTPNNWVGGATLYSNGLAGLDLAPVNDPLVGKKSWFMFDDEVVCLGAGITDTSAADVQTAAINRKIALSNTNAFSINGTNMPTTLGWQTNFTGANWCSLANFGGCYFPGSANIKLLRQARTNSWSQINSGGTTTLQSNCFLTLWFDHGAKPTNASYAYTLLPNYTPAQSSNYAAAPETTILENSTNAQAVKETTLNVVAANFWRDATKTVDLITVNHKASVITQAGSGVFSVAVADPTQTNTVGIFVTLNTNAYRVLSADPAITVTQVQPIQFTVNTTGAFGRSISATFVTSNSPPYWTNIPAINVLPGITSTLNLSNYAGDPDLPYQTLSFALVNGPTNSSVNSATGVFSITPSLTQAGTTRPVIVSATDHGATNSLTTTTSFNLHVYNLPVLSLVGFTNGQFTLGVNGDSGPSYLVQASTNLTDWQTIYTATQPALPFIWADTNATPFTRRFYRVFLGQ